jgi:hypothetical protein
MTSNEYGVRLFIAKKGRLRAGQATPAPDPCTGTSCVGRCAAWLIGDRYAATLILLIDSLAIVAIDAHLRRGGDPAQRARRGMAAAALAALFGAMWASDFSYTGMGGASPPWSQLVSGFQQRCERQASPAACARLPPMDWTRVPPGCPARCLTQRQHGT